MELFLYRKSLNEKYLISDIVKWKNICTFATHFGLKPSWMKIKYLK